MEALKAEKEAAAAAEPAGAGAGQAVDEAAAAAAEFKGTDDENAAATKLQAFQRGTAARAEVAAKKAELAAAPAAASAAAPAAKEGDTYSTAPGFPLAELKRSFQEAAALGDGRALHSCTQLCVPFSAQLEPSQLRGRCTASPF